MEHGILTRQNIIDYLHILNEKLKQHEQYGKMVIAGGASFCLVHEAREATHDIDAVFEPSADLHVLIREIAKEHDLHEDWLNDSVKAFLTPQMKTETVMTLSNLTVSTVDAKGLLALKLTSARSDTLDAADSMFLMRALDIQSEEELFSIIEENTHCNQRTARCQFFAQEVFRQYRERYGARPRTGQ